MVKRRKWPDYPGQLKAKQSKLLGRGNIPKKEFHPTRAGVVGVFHNALGYGSTRDVMSYYEKKRGRKTAFGPFHGFIIGEVPADQPGVRGEHGRIRFEYYRDDPRIERRKRGGAHLRKRGIRKWEYNKYLKDNPVDKLLAGKAVKRAPTQEQILKRIAVRDARAAKKLKVQKALTPDEAFEKMKRDRGLK